MDTTQTTAKLLTNRVMQAVTPELQRIKSDITTLSRAIDGLNAHAALMEQARIDFARMAKDLGAQMTAMRERIDALATPAPGPEKPKREPRMIERFGGKIADPFPPGSKHPSAKLTEAQALEIIALRQNGFKGREIAEAFGISESNVYLITSGKGWKHLPRPQNGVVSG